MVNEMKIVTESRYWCEFNQYEQWLINQDRLSSRDCYSVTHKMSEEYLIELSRYVLTMKKRFKRNTVKTKVSRLIQCFRCALGDSLLDLIRESCNVPTICGI